MQPDNKPKNNQPERLVRPTVLLVDDDPAVLESLGRYLQVAGYGVLTADDVDGAFDALRQFDR